MPTLSMLSVLIVSTNILTNEYKIIYDEDLNFNSRSFKYYIKNNKDIIDKYHITFIHPERMV